MSRVDDARCPLWGGSGAPLGGWPSRQHQQTLALASMPADCRCPPPLGHTSASLFKFLRGDVTAPPLRSVPGAGDEPPECMQVDGSQREPGEGARPRGTPPPPLDEDEHEDNDPGGDTTEEDENFPPLMKGRHDFRASDLFPWMELERPAESKDVPNLDQMSLQHMMDPALDMLYDAKTDMFTFFESGDPVWFEGTLPSQAGRPPPADRNPRPGKEMLAADWLEDRTEDGWGYVQVMHSPDYEHPPCGRFGPPRLWKVLQSV